MTKVLVTGAGGFIGSHLVERLVAEGYRVRALVRYNSAADPRNLSLFPRETFEKLDILFGDITDARLVEEAVEGCDAVFHLAALIGIPYSYHAPASYVNVNIGGTLHVLEACRRHGVRRMIHTSTSEVYGTALYTPIDEEHPLQGQSPYSASKIGADKLAESYFRSFDLPVVTLRPFNTFGPRQSARAVIPTVLAQALAGAETIRLGNLEARRDLNYVADTVQAFLLAADTEGIEGETIHFGSGRDHSIRELAERCLEIAGSDASLEVAEERLRPEKSEVGLLQCSPEKAKRLLGWEPASSLEEEIAETARFIREHPDLYDPSAYMV